MVSAPVETAPAAPPASAAGTAPASDERVNPTQAIAPDAAAPVETAAPAQEQAPPAESTTPASPSEPDYDDLQRRHDAIAGGATDVEPLTSQERQALARHQQSVADSNRAQQQAQQQYRQNVERIRGLTEQLPAKLEDVFVKRLGIDPENPQATPLLELARREMVEALGSTFREIEPIVLQPWEAAIHSTILEWGGNDAEARRAVESLRGKSFDQQLLGLANAGIALGRKSSPDGKKVEALTKERDSLKSELAKLTGQRLAGAGTPATTGTASGSTTEPQNMREVRQMHVGQHPSGRRLSTAEMRSYQQKNSQGQFPD